MTKIAKFKQFVILGFFLTLVCYLGFLFLGELFCVLFFGILYPLHTCSYI